MSIERVEPPETEEIEIEIVDATPEEDRGRIALPPETDEDIETRAKEMDDYGERAQKRFNELTHRYHDERRAKEEALRKATEADTFAQSVYEENQKLKQTLEWGRNEYINEFNAKLNAAQELAEQTYRQAYEAGDAEKIIQAQKAFSEIAVQRARLSAMPQQVSQPVQEPTVRDEPLTSKKEPETIAQAQSYNEAPPAVADPKTEEWHLRNPWFGQDKDMTALTMGIHSRLIEDGFEPASDEYFAAIDKEVRQRFPEKFGKPRKSSPVAPAGRSAATKKVTLTQTEVARAQKYGIPLERYAAEKAKIMEAN